MLPRLDTNRIRRRRETNRHIRPRNLPCEHAQTVHDGSMIKRYVSNEKFRPVSSPNREPLIKPEYIPLLEQIGVPQDQWQDYIRALDTIVYHVFDDNRIDLEI
jgi:hypothetical protein